jgi:hypothetical protein
MEILISVYSPSGKVTAASITPEMKTMMTAKNLLGKINATKNTVFYCIYQLCRKMTQRVLSSRAPYRYNSCFTRINAKRGISKINDGRCFP